MEYRKDETPALVFFGLAIAGMVVSIIVAMLGKYLF